MKKKNKPLCAVNGCFTVGNLTGICKYASVSEPTRCMAHGNKKSSQLDTKQFCEVGEEMGRRLAMSKGISVEWPSRNSLMLEQLDKVN